MSPAEFFLDETILLCLYCVREAKYQYKHLNETNDCRVFVVLSAALITVHVQYDELTDFMTSPCVRNNSTKCTTHIVHFVHYRT